MLDGSSSGSARSQKNAFDGIIGGSTFSKTKLVFLALASAVEMFV